MGPLALPSDQAEVLDRPRERGIIAGWQQAMTAEFVGEPDDLTGLR